MGRIVRYKFTAFLSPVTMKTTIVLDQVLADNGAFGVSNLKDANGVPIAGSGENVRLELGAFVKMVYKTPLVENVDFTTKLELFSNYLDRPENIDVNWENLIAMKVNEFLSVNITTQLLYDNDINIIRDPGEFDPDGNVIRAPSIGPATQFKQTMALGLTYKF